jgi:hypothetical protein
MHQHKNVTITDARGLAGPPPKPWCDCATPRVDTVTLLTYPAETPTRREQCCACGRRTEAQYVADEVEAAIAEADAEREHDEIADSERADRLARVPVTDHDTMAAALARLCETAAQVGADVPAAVSRAYYRSTLPPYDAVRAVEDETRALLVSEGWAMACHVARTAGDVHPLLRFGVRHQIAYDSGTSTSTTHLWLGDFGPITIPTSRPDSLDMALNVLTREMLAQRERKAAVARRGPTIDEEMAQAILSCIPKQAARVIVTGPAAQVALVRAVAAATYQRGEDVEVRADLYENYRLCIPLAEVHEAGDFDVVIDVRPTVTTLLKNRFGPTGRYDVQTEVERLRQESSPAAVAPSGPATAWACGCTDQSYCTAHAREALVSGDRPAASSLATNALRESIAPSTDCTGIAATWCPLHGDCSCPREEDGSPVMFHGPFGHGSQVVHDDDCPLHGTGSLHATTVHGGMLEVPADYEELAMAMMECRPPRESPKPATGARAEQAAGFSLDPAYAHAPGSLDALPLGSAPGERERLSAAIAADGGLRNERDLRRRRERIGNDLAQALVRVLHHLGLHAPDRARALGKLWPITVSPRLTGCARTPKPDTVERAEQACGLSLDPAYAHAPGSLDAYPLGQAPGEREADDDMLLRAFTTPLFPRPRMTEAQMRGEWSVTSTPYEAPIRIDGKAVP